MDQLEEQLVMPPGARKASKNKTLIFNQSSQTLAVSNTANFIKEAIPFGLILSCTIKRISTGLIS